MNRHQAELTRRTALMAAELYEVVQFGPNGQRTYMRFREGRPV